MTYEELHNYIRDRFNVYVEQVENVPVEYDNAPFAMPNNSPWIRFSIRDGAAVQIEFGGPKRFRMPGVAIAQIFGPIELGDQRLLEIGGTILSVFRIERADGVRYGTPWLQTIGRSGAFWQVNVNIPFVADDTTTS